MGIHGARGARRKVRTLWLTVFGGSLLVGGMLPCLAAGSVEPVRGHAAGGPLHFSLIDQLPSQPITGATAFNSLEERRRLPVLDAALQDLVREGRLPGAILINKSAELRAGLSSEKPQRPGTVIVRIFVTQWAQSPLGGPADTEILCRMFVEEVRDGNRLAAFGPYLGRARREIALAAPAQNELRAYQAAAREALAQFAGRLQR